MDRYPNIADHGLIGDLQTAALVTTDGTIDWFCCPRFDSPSVFASLLDAEQGGYFRIAPDGDDYVTKQLYLPDTAILITRFITPNGVGEVIDFMPVDHRARRPTGTGWCGRCAWSAARCGSRSSSSRAFDYAQAAAQDGDDRERRRVPRRRHGADAARVGLPGGMPRGPASRSSGTVTGCARADAASRARSAAWCWSRWAGSRAG